MLITVVIPAYNCESTIRRCVESILNQSYSKLEIILINDGSTDNTEEICEEIASTDDRIIFFSNKNMGVSLTRNMGISFARGEYITFVDGDDYIEKDMYSKMLESIKKHNSDICVCGYNTVTDKSSQLHSLPFDTEYLDREEIEKTYVPLLIGNSSNKSIIGSCWCCLYASRIIKKIPFLREIKLQEDTLFNIESFLDKETRKVSFVNEGFYNYYFVSNSATNKYREDAYIQISLIEEKLASFVKQLSEQGIDCTENFRNTVFKWILYLLKNYSANDCPLKIREVKKILTELFEKDSFKSCVENIEPVGFKRRAIVWLIKHRMYGLLIIVWLIKHRMYELLIMVLRG